MSRLKLYPKGGIAIFGWLEILLGLGTALTVTISLSQGWSTKSLSTLCFVYSASIVSISLGIGILRYNLASYRLLLFFAKVIILSKILIFGRIINLSGELETVVPQQVKDLISIVYHFIILWYFGLAPVKKYFGERRNAYHV